MAAATSCAATATSSKGEQRAAGHERCSDECDGRASLVVSRWAAFRHQQQVRGDQLCKVLTHVLQVGRVDGQRDPGCHTVPRSSPLDPESPLGVRLRELERKVGCGGWRAAARRRKLLRGTRRQRADHQWNDRAELG